MTVDKVKVAVRVRPFNRREIELKTQRLIDRLKYVPIEIIIVGADGTPLLSCFSSLQMIIFVPVYIQTMDRCVYNVYYNGDICVLANRNDNFILMNKVRMCIVEMFFKLFRAFIKTCVNLLNTPTRSKIRP